MHHKFKILAKSFTPSLRTTHRMVAKAKTATDVYETLNATLHTLLTIKEQINRTKADLSEEGKPYEECLFFETAAANIDLGINFLRNVTVTPQNKKQILKFLSAAYLHMKKCRDRDE